MAETASRHVLTEAIWPAEGPALWAKRAVLVGLGILALTAAAQIKVPVWPSPVLMNLGTFAVLTIARRLRPAARARHHGGLDADRRARLRRLPELDRREPRPRLHAGPTGGYLVGYLLATVALGYAARRGWDRSVGGMATALLAGNVLIYVPGLLWLGYLIANGLFDPAKYASVWDQTLAWGLTPVPDRRRPEARAGRAAGARPLEARRQRPRLSRR